MVVTSEPFKVNSKNRAWAYERFDFLIDCLKSNLVFPRLMPHEAIPEILKLISGVKGNSFKARKMLKKFDVYQEVLTEESPNFSWKYLRKANIELTQLNSDYKIEVPSLEYVDRFSANLPFKDGFDISLEKKVLEFKQESRQRYVDYLLEKKLLPSADYLLDFFGESKVMEVHSCFIPMFFSSDEGEKKVHDIYQNMHRNRIARLRHRYVHKLLKELN